MMQEKELLEKSKQGDPEAFTQLIQPYTSLVYYVCLKIVKEESSAQDLTQDTLVKAYQKLATFEGRAKFSSWLYKIAYNLSLNYLKKKKRQHEEEFREEIFVASLPEEQRELEDIVQPLLSTLTPKLRVVFEMYEMQKKAQKAIAAELGIPEGTVRSRLYYARRHLQKQLRSQRSK